MPLRDTDGEYAEKILVPLVRRYGLRRVESCLAGLIGQADWQAWQRVSTIAKHVNTRIKEKSAAQQRMLAA